MGVFYENPVYIKVASVELPTKVSSSTFSNNNNVHLKRENVEKIANDHHGDHRSVLKHQTNTSAECTLDAGILDENPVAGILDENPVSGILEKITCRNNSANRIRCSTTSAKRVKIDEAFGSKTLSSDIMKKPKSELTEFGKLPSSEFTSSEKYPKLKGQVKCLGGMKIKM
ncbi:hypothetical protein OROMI_018499 [Orobanche minor]